MKIGQFSKKSGLTNYTIRYYEKIGVLDKPDIDDSGHRDYKQSDLELINWVSCLKNSGMSLQKIKEYSQAFRKKDTLKVVEILELHFFKLIAKKKDIDHYIEVTKEKLLNLKNS